MFEMQNTFRVGQRALRRNKALFLGGYLCELFIRGIGEFDPLRLGKNRELDKVLKEIGLVYEKRVEIIVFIRKKINEQIRGD